jgi:Leucine-rich repeat (LRR) protein
MIIDSTGFETLYPENHINDLNSPWGNTIAINPLRKATPTTNKAVSSTAILTNGNGKFGAGLAKWCDESNLSSNEQTGRVSAAKRILNVYNYRVRAAALSILGIRHRYANLDLSGLGLTSLPDQLWELNVEVLNISNNKFANLPEKIGGLTHLRLLDIREFGPTNDAFNPSIVTQSKNKRTLLDSTNYVYRYLMRSDCRFITKGETEDLIETIGEIRIRTLREQLNRQSDTSGQGLILKLATIPFGSADF